LAIKRKLGKGQAALTEKNRTIGTVKESEDWFTNQRNELKSLGGKEGATYKKKLLSLE